MPENQKMDSKISLRLPVSVCQAWKDAAASAGLCLGDWVRTQIAVDGVDQVVSKKPTPRKVPDLAKRRFVPADPALINQVARLGNNLNQIARSINRSGLEASDQFQLLEQLLLIQQQLERLVNNAIYDSTQPGEAHHAH